MSESKALTSQQKFEEKLYTRLRDDVSELLPDEVLSEMAQKAIKKMFFQPLSVTVQEYGNSIKKDLKYSWFEAKVETLLRSRLDAMAKKWLKDNEDFLAEQFATVMSAKMPELIAGAIFKPVDNAIMNIEEQLKQQISVYMQNQFQNSGHMIVPMT